VADRRPADEGLKERLSRTEKELAEARAALEREERSHQTLADDHTVAEAALRQSEESFRVLFAQNPQPMWVFDPDTLRFLEVNDAAVAHYGHPRERFLEMTLADIVPTAEVDAFMRQVTRAGSSYQPSGTHRHQVAGGRIMEVELSSHRLEFGGQPAVVTAVKDVTMQRALERELRHQALHDPLTGLSNRALLVDRIQRSLNRLDRHAGAVAAIFVDLDRFKLINDSLGHDVGDRVLTETASRLRAAIRQEDTVARFGGDEFVICAEVIDADEAVGIAGRALESLTPPFRHDGHEMLLTGSVGVSVAAVASATPETLLRDADWAMYRAKEEGGNRVELFDRGLRSRLLARLEMERSLRRALGGDEMRVLYQPIVSVPDGRVVGAEALVRWFHPKHGVIGPAEFIPVAEETGMIAPLGAWVFEEACRQWVSWRRKAGRREPINLAINVSARQLTVPSTFDTFYDILSRTGADPAHVSLEITESVLMEGNDSILEAMLALKWLGVRLNLDDFGTRYSSLSYLRRLPFDTLKVDQSFVSGLRDDSRDQAIVRSVVGLAHALGLDVVAEGVETPEQFSLLGEMGADRAQGYLLGRPVEADDFPFDTLMLVGAGPTP